MKIDSVAEDLAYGDAVRKQIEHEDGLLVNRLSWLIASQSFLFTAFALVLNGPTQTRLEVFTRQQDLLAHLLPIIGLSVCILIYLGVLAGLRVMASLRVDLLEHHAKALNFRPPIQGSQLTLILGHAAPILLPLIFAAAWVSLLIIPYLNHLGRAA
jgi:hypothetical protein